MNLTEFSSRLSLVGADAIRVPDGLSVSAQLHAASGNQLLALDAWAGAGAAERLLSTRSEARASAPMQLDQLVNHILAPLGRGGP